MTEEPEIRAMTLEETRQLLQWAADEGWNPSPDDTAAFYSADPSGFIGCFRKNELLSGISAVSYGENFGFIGLYITRADARGKGFGLSVWNAAMRRLAGRTIGLDGVPAQQKNYETMGFRKLYGSTRWSGRTQATNPSDLCADAVRHDFEEIVSFDREFFPAPREAFLSAWTAKPRHVLVSRSDGSLSGYAAIRKCFEGFKIGPLFARNIEAALSLFDACTVVADGATLHLDVPDLQSKFQQELALRGFESGFDTARMYLGPPPRVDMSGVFAVTTLELG